MPAGKRYRRIRSVNGTAITVWGQSITAAQIPAGTEVVVCEFRVLASYQSVVEQFVGLTLEQVPGKFFMDVINNGSNLIAVSWAAAPASGLRHPMLIPSAPDGLTIVLGTGGTDGNPPTAADYRGTTTAGGLHTGIKALEDIDQVSIIAAPGATNQLVQNALIEQCERLKDRFAILDPAPRGGNQPPLLTDALNQRNLYDTKYAALYYPRLMLFDPISETNIPGPPSGHIAGIYARTDIELGVHVAPANQVVRGITDLELVINKENQDILNPKNVNVIRDFRADGRGLRVWGARCLTSDTEWKYVPVRRLFIFLEESLDRGNAMGGFPSQRRATVGAREAGRGEFPKTRLAGWRLAGCDARRGILRQGGSHHHDAGRHRQWSANYDHRRRCGEARGIRHHSDRPVERRQRGDGRLRIKKRRQHNGKPRRKN